jgi:lipopolysaccharide heptosyltransferase I
MARPAPSHLDDGNRILVVRLGAMGDVLRTLPAVGVIRRTFPTARISWIVEDLSYPLIDGHPAVNEPIRFPRRALREAVRRPARLAAILRDLRADLRSRRFDVTLDFQGSLKSALVAWISGAPRRVGFAAGQAREGSHLFSTHQLRPPAAPVNRVERALLLAEAVGARGDEVAVGLPERAEDGEAAGRILADLAPDGGPVVILSPGTSELQRHKRWPPARYGAVAAALAGSGAVLPLIAWGPGEETLAAAVVAAAGGRAAPAPRTTIPVLAALLRRAALFVGGDTGPMHLAWAVGCPVLALFGPTDPRLNAPIGREHVVLRARRRMEDLEAATVARAALAILGRAGASSAGSGRPPIPARPAPTFPRQPLPLPEGTRT